LVVTIVVASTTMGGSHKEVDSGQVARGAVHWPFLASKLEAGLSFATSSDDTPMSPPWAGYPCFRTEPLSSLHVGKKIKKIITPNSPKF
jgi:hypothetical protein